MKKENRIDRRKARAWMIEQDMRLVDIQRALGHKYATQSIETLKGIRSHRAVLQYLLDQGCPAEHLALPADMKDAA